jgi:fumigallin biosynthesis monooxygenase-like protein
MPARRETVDLSEHPDLVVIYLGMRLHSLRGIRRLASLGPQIEKSVQAKPPGLLLHERLFLSPRHAGMRQYWHDFDSLEAWTRTLPHKAWWRDFLRDPAGTGFWHELYSRAGDMEAVYIDMPPLGLGAVMPRHPARGSMFSARRRLRRAGEGPPPVLAETELSDA